VRSLVILAVLAGAATAAPAPIHVTYDSAHLDLDKHELQFKPSRAVTEATLVAIGEDGTELGKGSASYTDADKDWLAITWTQPPNTKLMMLKLRVAAADGVATNVELVPWSVSVEHEDVNFATDSSTIEPDEAKKLDASLAKIEDVVKHAEKFMKVRLYIAGHTDTVGPSAKNRKLSLSRAQAIAKYFRGKGLTVMIAVAGFGEDVLKVKTADSTDERANRRADYVIGPAAGAPPFGGAYLKAKATWSPIK
jgi:outer membrane protein OmpA-like peptidoglycan-associated protein